MAKTIKKHGKVALIIGLALMLLAMYAAIPMGKAAQLQNRETKISDSRPGDAGGTDVDYDFGADGSTTTDIYCLKVYFCDTATGSCNKPGGMSFDSPDKGDPADWANVTSTNWAINATDTTWITATTTSSGEKLGTNGSWVFGNITNATGTGTYFARLYTYSDQGCSTEVDSGVTAFAIISGIAVSATVAETLTFEIASATSGECTGDSSSTSPTIVDTTATTTSFGELGTDVFSIACHKLKCNTNAAGGYNLTSQETDQLTYDASTIPDTTCDASCSETAFALWATESNNGFGHSCEDVTGNPCESGYNFAADPNYRQFASIVGAETAQTMMSASGATSTDAKVHYKISVGSGQAAGAYSNTVVYIATPTY